MTKIVVSLVAFILLSSSIVAQEVNTNNHSKREVLGDHTFQSLSYFRTSFISTNVQVNVGLGSTPILNLGAINIGNFKLISFSGRITFVDVRVKYQQRVRPWLAFYMTAEMAARVGTDISTIVADGVNTFTGGKIGWLIRLKNTDRFNLSTNVYLSNYNGNFINVNKLIQDALNGDTLVSLTTKIPSLTANLGLHGAYAFNSTYGLQFFTDVSYGESFERDRSQAYLSAGIMGEMDLYPRFRIPLGFALGYVITSDPEAVTAESGFSNILIGKLGYTAANEFELGIQYSVLNVDIKSVEQETYVSKVLLTFKFFF